MTFTTNVRRSINAYRLRNFRRVYILRGTRRRRGQLIVRRLCGYSLLNVFSHRPLNSLHNSRGHVVFNSPNSFFIRIFLSSIRTFGSGWIRLIQKITFVFVRRYGRRF